MVAGGGVGGQGGGGQSLAFRGGENEGTAGPGIG